MVTVARLIFAKNWENGKQINLEDWYKEMWNLAINNKLTGEMEIRRGRVKSNDFKDLWNSNMEYVSSTGKGYRLAEESMNFWRRMGWKSVQMAIAGHLLLRVKVAWLGEEFKVHRV